MNQILAALLNAQPAATAPSSTTPSTPSTPASTDPTSTAQFKSQFDQAVATLTNTVTPSTQGTTTTQSTTTGAAQATTAGSTVQSVASADSLQVTLQKKIADLLAKGESVSEIVQQLAASLAATYAQQFGGDPAQIQNQLQTAFASALAPPTTTGPPLSNTDLASALAQRFRQVADVAAGVLGEQGQSNRLFAGSTSDAATTAGVQPAPTTTSTVTTPADSTADDAQALLAALTASDGKTVATTNGASLSGSNGDTLLGRILTRAAQSQTTTAPAPQELTPADLSGISTPSLASMALAAAAAALGSSPATSTPTPLATDSSAAAISRIAASADAPVAQAVTLATQAPAPLSPTVTAFLKTFADALTLSTPTNVKSAAATTDPGTLLQTDITSAQAPTIGAFASVQAAIAPDATGADASQSTQSQTPSQTTTVDQTDVVNQLLRGAFINTTGDVSTVRLRLVPETLGDISVKLTIEGNNVSAQVMAQTPAAHDALVAGQQQLTRSLADAGLKLTSFNVDLAGGFASFQQQQQQQSSQQGQSQGRSLLLGGVDTTESDESTLNATPNFGPPVLANSNWSALNYLV
jgi:chemotaxis protein MotD